MGLIWKAGTRSDVLFLLSLYMDGVWCMRRYLVLIPYRANNQMHVEYRTYHLVCT